MNFIYQAIGSVLSWLDSVFGSYLIAIIVFAIFVKILLLPLGIKQQKNMQKQATLRPKEMAIRKKYKGRENDRDAMMRMQTEVQEMYRANNFNQFGGCLPALLQIPVVLIIYQAIVNPLSHICRFSAEVLTNIKTFIGANYQTFGIEQKLISETGVYNGSELQITSLLNNSEYLKIIAENVEGVTGATIPHFSLWGIDLGATPSFTSWLIIIPILTFLVQFGSMKLNRMMSYQPMEMQGQGCSNWIMDIMMPMMLTFMAFSFPALLGIYWIFQSLFGVLQQFILKKIFPMPVFTEADYKEAEKAMRGKGTNRTIDTGKKYRSLHNIDADDEE